MSCHRVEKQLPPEIYGQLTHIFHKNVDCGSSMSIIPDEAAAVLTQTILPGPRLVPATRPPRKDLEADSKMSADDAKLPGGLPRKLHHMRHQVSATAHRSVVVLCSGFARDAGGVCGGWRACNPECG
jgi:hypothetical protein